LDIYDDILGPLKLALWKVDILHMATRSGTRFTKLILLVATVSIASGRTLISTGKNLPVSFSSGGLGGINANGCKLNTSETQAVASGTLKSAPQVPNNIQGQPLPDAVLQMQLQVVDANGDTLGMGTSSLQTGSTNWQVTSEVRAGSNPTGCVLLLQWTANYG
jgi:hypothetical protein